MSYNWEPVGFRVLVKPEVIEEKTAGGIIKPASVVDQEQGGVSTGVVVAIGPTAFEQDGGARFWCKVGDVIKWPRYTGRPDVDEETGEIYHVLNDQDILLKRG